MDQGLATIVAAGVAAGVAATSYVVTQASVRRERRAARFAEAVLAIYRYAGSPSTIFSRPAEDPLIRDQIAKDHGVSSSVVRYHLNLLRVEAPLVGEAYFDVFSRVRRLGPVFRAWAWRHPPVAEEADMQVPAAFYYDFDPELGLLLRCMRVEQSFWPGWRQRRRLRRELAALRQKRSADPIPTFAELDHRRIQAVSAQLAEWERARS